MSKLFALLMLDVYLWHGFLLFSFLQHLTRLFFCESLHVNSHVILVHNLYMVMVSMMSSIETTPRRQPYSSRMMEMCSRFSSIFSHI